MKKNILITLTIVVAAVLLRFVYAQFGQFMAAKAKRGARAPEVVVEQIGTQEITRSFEAPGRVVSRYRVGVNARIDGNLEKSYFKEGDYVKAGQVLFLIEPAQYQNMAASQKADVDNVTAQLGFAEKQLARAKELVEKDYISKAQYDELLAKRDSLKASLELEKAQYDDALRNLSYTRVTAPVDGQVGIINVTVGNYVSLSSGDLTTLNSTNPIYVTFPLEINDFTTLVNADGAEGKNRKVELILPGNQPYAITGFQDFQDNKIDQSTGTVTMRATFENPNNELIHGEFVTVRLYANKPANVPVVPQLAVQENQSGKYVYKLDKDGIPQLTYIKTGRQEGSFYIVNEGLGKGDKVVTDGIQKVIPGKPVTVVNSEKQ